MLASCYPSSCSLRFLLWYALPVWAVTQTATAAERLAEDMEACVEAQTGAAARFAAQLDQRDALMTRLLALVHTAPDAQAARLDFLRDTIHLNTGLHKLHLQRILELQKEEQDTLEKLAAALRRAAKSSPPARPDEEEGLTQPGLSGALPKKTLLAALLLLASLGLLWRHAQPRQEEAAGLWKRWPRRS